MDIIWNDHIIKAVPEDESVSMVHGKKNGRVVVGYLLLGNFISCTILATNNQNGLVLILWNESLHRRMRQNHLLGLNLLDKYNEMGII